MHMPTMLVEELPDAAGTFDERTERQVDKIRRRLVSNGVPYTAAWRYAIWEVLWADNE